MFKAHNQRLQTKPYHFQNTGLKALGKYLFLTGEYKKANKIFENILKTQPDDAETLYELSQTSRCINDNQEKANKYHHQAVSIRLNEYIASRDNPEQTEPLNLTTYNKNDDAEMMGENSGTHFDQDGH